MAESEVDYVVQKPLDPQRLRAVIREPAGSGSVEG